MSVPSCFLKKHFKVDPSPNQKACKVLDYRFNLKEGLRLGSFDAGISRSSRASPY